MGSTDSLEGRASGKPAMAVELERRALAIVSRPHATEPDSIVAGLEREIAFVMEQIETLRATRDRLSKNLLQIECYVNTELLQMEQRTPRYSPYRYPEREKLQRRLLDIEHERRDRSVTHEQRLAELHKRLLDLLNQHAVLTLDEWTSNDLRRNSSR